jgi:rod shape-determining protein MreC
MLLVGNYRYQRFNQVRTTLSIVVIPVQYLVNLPLEFLQITHDYLTSKQKLIKENEDLRVKLLLQQAKVQQMVVIQQENSQLHALLHSPVYRQNEHNKYLVAQILAVSSNPNNQQVILNQGSQNGVYLGQPVLDAYGVMGQVVEVEPFISRVVLISNPRSAVPVQDARNGVVGVVIGYAGYSDLVRLTNITATTDVKPGDLLITSGLGNGFPVGYPVGIVKSVENMADERFAKILVTPFAQINRSKNVLLIWPQRSKFIMPIQEMLSH